MSTYNKDIIIIIITEVYYIELHKELSEMPCQSIT